MVGLIPGHATNAFSELRLIIEHFNRELCIRPVFPTGAAA